MNKYIIGIFIVVVAGIAFSFMATNNEESAVTSHVASALIAERTFHDFGTVDIFSGKVSTEYKLKNTGEEDLTILSGVTSCMCTEGEIDGMRFGMHASTDQKVVIPAGEEKVLTAIFDPLAHGPDGTGKMRRELTLSTNSSETPRVMVSFAINVVKN